MHVVELRLTNWVRYKGTHKLRFEPSVYGIVARHCDDEGRSNWLGKTSILRAIRFALFGISGAPTEDEWITNGEAEGSVGVTLSSDMTIERTRKRGKSTQVEVKLGEKQANGTDAQRVIDAALGLTGKDFAATSYFEQKSISQYVSAQPAERMRTIVGWLNLEALQRAEKRVSTALSALETQEAKHVGALQSIDARVVEILSRYFDDVAEVDPAEAIAELESVAADLRKVADAKKAIVDDMDRDRDALEAWRRDAASAEHRAELLAEAEALEGKIDRKKLAALDKQVAACRSTLESMAGDLRAADDDCRAKAALAQGKFDGVCPVDGHECPDASKMNAERARNTKAAEAAAVKLATIKGRKSQVDEQADKLAAEIHQLHKLDAQARKLRESAEAEALVKACERIERDGKPPDDTAASDAKSEATKAAFAADGEAREAERYASELRLVYQRRAQAVVERDAVVKRAGTHREALAILGRNGAQRRIAEGALAEIDAGANAMLADAGIALTITQTWRHPTKGLGDTCENCGAAFPSSAKVKSCEKCETPRPPKYIERPEIRLSNVSGAAEDVAGVAIQLSAAAWLREQRGTRWAAVCIDEPFGSLDSTHRRALAVHLATMIKGQGFEQAFIVSHNRDVNDALPALVQVTGDDEGSKVEVV